MITEITRSHVRLFIDSKTITIQGEGYVRGYGNPDFVAYKNSIQRWDPPDSVSLIDEETKDQILSDLKAEMAARGMTIEIE